MAESYATEPVNRDATHPEPIPDPAVRLAVKNLLTRCPAFRNLPPAQQMEVAQNTVKVADYIATGGGVKKGTPMDVEVNQMASVPRPASLATAQAAGQPAPQRQPLQQPPTVTQEGVQDFGNLVQTVDFPKF